MVHHKNDKEASSGSDCCGCGHNHHHPAEHPTGHHGHPHHHAPDHEKHEAIIHVQARTGHQKGSHGSVEKDRS